MSPSLKTGGRDKRPIALPLTASPASVPRARHCVEEFAAGAHLLTDIAETLAMVVSELVTNAVMHGEEPIVLVVALRGGVVRIEVSDGDPHAKSVRFREVDVPVVGGRGLRIVALLADDWGVEATAQGKIVWVTCKAAAKNRSG